MNYTAKDIYTSANNFNVASLALNEKLSETDDVATYLAPIITVTSFTIELYLKCIYLIENGKPAPKKHNLDVLFGLLREDSKKIIETIYNMCVQNNQNVMALKARVPEMNVDLEHVFSEISEAFVKWRYSYQEPICGFPTGGQIIEALITRIKLFGPEW